ncbi:hypothetical protein GCM10023173_11210 [Sphingobacterium thermophilum]|uniref:Uncharacterized protein n=1 Tax=Sphingobacterium thermophilum TaxID=768534 RepID=A0ABP8R063_9SPHI
MKTMRPEDKTKDILLKINIINQWFKDKKVFSIGISAFPEIITFQTEDQTHIQLKLYK